MFAMSPIPIGFGVKSDGKRVKCPLYPCKTNKNTKLSLIKNLKKKRKEKQEY